MSIIYETENQYPSPLHVHFSDCLLIRTFVLILERSDKRKVGQGALDGLLDILNGQSDNGYDPFFVITTLFFPQSWLFTEFETKATTGTASEAETENPSGAHKFPSFI